MDGTTYTTIADALKRDYLPKLLTQVDKGVKTFDLFTKDSEGIKGRDIYLKMFKTYPQGVGPVAAGEFLPTPSAAGYKEAKVQAKRNYATIQFDAMLETEANAIVDAIDFEMQAMEESLKKELNYQLAFGDGTGARAEVASLAGQVITVDAGAIESGATLGKYAGHEDNFLYPKMIIDVYTAAGVLRQAGLVITSINRATHAVTVTGTCTGIVDTDLIYRAGSKDLCMMGLPGMVKDSGTLQTVDPTVDDWWKSYKKDMDGKWGANDTDFFDKIQETIDEIELNSIGKIDLIYGWPLFLRQYRAAMQAQKRTVNTLAFKEGRKGLAFTTEDGEVALMRDKYLPYYKVFFLDSDKLAVKTLKSLHWEEKGGIMKLLERKDVYTAWMKLYSEFAITTRNACGYWLDTGTTVLDYT